MDISTSTIVGQVTHDPQIVVAFSALALAVLKAGSLVIMAMLGKLIKTQLNEKNSTWKQKLAYRLVCYADKQITGNDERKQYVANWLVQKFPKMSPEEAKHLIEEAVVKLQSSQAPTPNE